MTKYNSRAWTSHLFDIEGSMVREIFRRVAACVLGAAIVVLISVVSPETIRYFSIPVTAHSLIGTALGLLLVFRTNSSYDRFWEGRKQWGGINNECRNLARQANIWLAADPKLMREVIRWTIAFPYATMQRLWGLPGLGVAFNDVSPADVARVEASKHLPLAISRLLTQRLFTACQQGLIDSRQLIAFDQNLTLLVDYCGACERIHSTPMPFAYAVHLRRVLIVYGMTLPLAFVKDFGWATIPATLLTSYILFGVEEIGVEIEDPFERTVNDLPIQSYCQGINAILSEICDESPDTALRLPFENHNS